MNITMIMINPSGELLSLPDVQTNRQPTPQKKERPAAKRDHFERADRLAGWMARRGGEATVREIVVNGVAGVKNAREARDLLRLLISQGRGRFEVVRSGRTRQRKEVFVLIPGGEG